MTISEVLLSIKKLFDFKEWLDDRKYAKRSDTRAIAKRVMRIFDAHDIPVARIASVFPEFNVQLSDFDNLDSIRKVITIRFLDRLSEHFFINRFWLDTGEGRIQDFYEVGYDFGSVYDLIVDYPIKHDEVITAHFMAEQNIIFVPTEDYDTNQNVMIVLQCREQKSEKNEFSYSRFLPVYFGYWDYYKTRMMIKAMSLLFFQDKKVLTQKGDFIHHLSENILANSFSAELIQNTVKLGLWHPDDFIFCNGKSAQEKDRVDAEQMHDYLKQIGFYQKIKELRSSRYFN